MELFAVTAKRNLPDIFRHTNRAIFITTPLVIAISYDVITGAISLASVVSIAVCRIITSYHSKPDYHPNDDNPEKFVKPFHRNLLLSFNLLPSRVNVSKSRISPIETLSGVLPKKFSF
jgi:hypothetical protein